MISKKFTPEEISDIITKLKVIYPDYEIKQCQSEPKFIRFTKIVGEQRVDTIPVSVVYTENVHIYECYIIVSDFSF